MDIQIIGLIVSTAGGLGTLIFLLVKSALKAISNMYKDMETIRKEQHIEHMKREKELKDDFLRREKEAKEANNKLMDYLDTKTQHDLMVASSLVQVTAELTYLKSNVSEGFECVKTRLDKIER